MTTESLAALLVPCHYCVPERVMAASLTVPEDCPRCGGAKFPALLRHLSELEELVLRLERDLYELRAQRGEPPSTLHERIKELERERDAALSKLEQVDEILICNWVGPRKDGDYRKALQDLISTSIREHNDPLISESAKLSEDRNAELRDRLARAESDTKRLDWLGSRGREMHTNSEAFNTFTEEYMRPQSDDNWSVGVNREGWHDGSSLREAIDAAIAKSQPQERSGS